MANIDILNLPVALGVAGAEWVPLVQANVTSRVQASLLVGGPALSNQNANFIFAGPSSGALSAPSFRLMVPADLPAVASSFFWNNSSGFLGLGTTSPNTNLTISQNAATLPSVTAVQQTLLQLGAADGNNTRMLIDSFGTGVSPIFTGRLARGTAASPSAVQTDDTLVQIGGRGFGQTVYSGGSRALINLNAGENWSDTAQGAYVSFQTTTNTTTIPAERMRIDNGGNLVIAAATNAAATYAIGTVTPVLQIPGTTASGTGMAQTRYSADNSGPTLFLTKSRGASIGTMTIVQSGDTVGVLNLAGADGTNFVPAAAISGVVDGTPGANNMPGRLVFLTTASGGSTLNERARIDNAGNMLIGTTTQVDKLTVGGGGIYATGANNVSLGLNKVGAGFQAQLGFALNGVVNAQITYDTSGNFVMQGPGSAQFNLFAGNSGSLNLNGGNSGSLTLNGGASGQIILQLGTNEVGRIPISGTFRFGGLDSATPVAQNFLVQSATGTNTSGVNWTLQGSLSTGSGTSGDIIFQTGGTGAGSTSQNTATTAFTLKGATQQAIFAVTPRINTTPSAVTHTVTITSAADSATNFGHVLQLNMNGTIYFIPCGTVQP